MAGSWMKERARIVRGTVSSDHIVQLFDGPESLGDAVSAFLQEGMTAGARLLVAAKAANVREISRGLADRGHSMPDLVTNGHLTVIDAHATLKALLRHDCPDAERFDAHLGDLVARLSLDSLAPLRIYGELVEILAEEGNFRGAAALEDLWNELGTLVPFSLLCGYSSVHFAAPGAERTLAHICARHTRVQQSHVDILGNWLLEQPHSVGAV
jgi:hypothetical protein